MGDMEISSGYPPPVLREAVTAAWSNSRTDVTRTTLSFMTHSNLEFYTVMRIHLNEVANGLAVTLYSLTLHSVTPREADVSANDRM